MWLRFDGADEDVRVLIIEAMPVLNAAGEIALDADGMPLYALRNLHLTEELLERLLLEGYEYLIFRMGDAVLLIPLNALERADHIFTLEPLRPDAMTAAEAGSARGVRSAGEAPSRVDSRAWRARRAVRNRRSAGRDLGRSRRGGGCGAVAPLRRRGRGGADAGRNAQIQNGAQADGPVWKLRVAELPQTEAKRMTFAPARPVAGAE